MALQRRWGYLNERQQRELRVMALHVPADEHQDMLSTIEELWEIWCEAEEAAQNPGARSHFQSIMKKHSIRKTDKVILHRPIGWIYLKYDDHLLKTRRRNFYDAAYHNEIVRYKLQGHLRIWQLRPEKLADRRHRNAPEHTEALELLKRIIEEKPDYFKTGFRKPKPGQQKKFTHRMVNELTQAWNTEKGLFREKAVSKDTMARILDQSTFCFDEEYPDLAYGI